MEDLQKSLAADAPPRNIPADFLKGGPAQEQALAKAREAMAGHSDAPGERATIAPTPAQPESLQLARDARGYYVLPPVAPQPTAQPQQYANFGGVEAPASPAAAAPAPAQSAAVAQPQPYTPFGEVAKGGAPAAAAPAEPLKPVINYQGTAPLPSPDDQSTARPAPAQAKPAEVVPVSPVRIDQEALKAAMDAKEAEQKAAQAKPAEGVPVYFGEAVEGESYDAKVLSSRPVGGVENSQGDIKAIESKFMKEEGVELSPSPLTMNPRDSIYHQRMPNPDSLEDTVAQAASQNTPTIQVQATLKPVNDENRVRDYTEALRRLMDYSGDNRYKPSMGSDATSLGELRGVEGNVIRDGYKDKKGNEAVQTFMEDVKGNMVSRNQFEGDLSTVFEALDKRVEAIVGRNQVQAQEEAPQKRTFGQWLVEKIPALTNVVAKFSSAVRSDVDAAVKTEPVQPQAPAPAPAPAKPEPAPVKAEPVTVKAEPVTVAPAKVGLWDAAEERVTDNKRKAEAFNVFSDIQSEAQAQAAQPQPVIKDVPVTDRPAIVSPKEDMPQRKESMADKVARERAESINIGPGI